MQHIRVATQLFSYCKRLVNDGRLKRKYHRKPKLAAAEAAPKARKKARKKKGG